MAENPVDTKHYAISIDAVAAEATLDRLTAKAERLRGLLAEINAQGNDLDDETGVAERIAPPQIVYTIDLGRLDQIVTVKNAEQVFAPQFRDKISRDLPQIVMPKPADKPAPDPKKSGDYKKSAIIKPFEA